MKYTFSVLGMVALLAGCTTSEMESGSLMSMYRADQAQSESVAPTLQEVTDTKTETAIADTQPAEAAPVVRYKHNVAVKEHTADYVTYEYKDIGISEVASLAIIYCQNQGGKQAFLREILLYRNHNRRATFDCSNLATAQ
jgi:putative hemolysin